MLDYEWDQDFKELIIKIKLDEQLKSKDIKLDLKEKSIKVFIREKLELEGEFLANLKIDNNLIYTIEDGILEITLDKQDGKFWDSLFVGSSKVDLTKVVEQRQAKFEDLDAEAQTMINKMMTQQNNRENSPGNNFQRTGNPQDDERIAEALQKMKEHAPINEVVPEDKENSDINAE